MKNILISIALLFLTLCSVSARQVTITITNTQSKEHLSEIVELEFSSLLEKLNMPKDNISENTSVIITDAQGTEIPSQITYDGKLIFPVPALKAKEQQTYYANIGKPTIYINKVYGRQYKERQDDFSFENDLIGYRLYGPDTQRRGERLYGYDIFNKKTTDLVLDQLYADQTDSKMWDTFNKLNKKGRKDLADALYMAFCYHIDHGKGMDCYKVGPTLGAGTNALIVPSEKDGNTEEDIIYPWCYKEFEILDNGPLRLTVKLVYEINVDGQKVYDIRHLTVDAGSNMIKAEIEYFPTTSNVVAEKAKMCAGIVVHNENPEAYVLNKEQRFMAYEDLGDVNTAWEGFREKQAKEMGRIFIGTFFPQQSKKTKNTLDMKFQEVKGISGVKGHILSSVPYQGTPVCYYFGSGWDRNPNTTFKTLDDWTEYLSKFSESKAFPLKIITK